MMRQGCGFSLVVLVPTVPGCPSPSLALPSTWEGGLQGWGGPAVHSRSSFSIQDFFGVMEKVTSLWFPLPNPGQTSTEGAFPGVNWVYIALLLAEEPPSPRTPPAEAGGV